MTEEVRVGQGQSFTEALASVGLVYTNIKAYLAIAQEACARSQELLTAARRPIPGDESRFVVTADPSHSSFKNALIAIAFAGIYLDALLYREGCRRLGKDAYLKSDRTGYAFKLKLLGIEDEAIFAACKKFTTIRNELVHEHALEPTPVRVAQTDAVFAIQFIETVTAAFEASSPSVPQGGG